MRRNAFMSVVSAIALGVAMASPAVSADTVKVKMLDKGPDGSARVFQPNLVFIEPGDTVHFMATDFGHDVAALPGLQPDGANGFSGYKNAPLKVTFTQPGVHVYECESHRKKGMVGVVVVGDASVNLDEIAAEMKTSDAVSDKGQKRLTGVLAKVREKVNGQ